MRDEDLRTKQATEASVRVNKPHSAKTFRAGTGGTFPMEVTVQHLHDL